MAQPILKAGALPGVKVNFVEAGVALGVKAVDDVAIPAATGEHGVKAKLDVGRELGGFAARFSGFNHGAYGATRSSVKVKRLRIYVRAPAVEGCGGHAHVLEVCRGVAVDEWKRGHAALRRLNHGGPRTRS